MKIRGKIGCQSTVFYDVFLGQLCFHHFFTDFSRHRFCRETRFMDKGFPSSLHSTFTAARCPTPIPTLGGPGTSWARPRAGTRVPEPPGVHGLGPMGPQGLSPLWPRVHEDLGLRPLDHEPLASGLWSPSQ